MRFVNISNNSIYTSITGEIRPGVMSSDKFRDFGDAIERVVKTCGTRLGVRLSKREAELLNKLMDLDSRGSSFKSEDIPEDIRNDPYGLKRAVEVNRISQQKAIDAVVASNSKSTARERFINGETSRERRPVGPATLGEEGEEVTPSKLKSGFEAIMEENARIAAGKQAKKVDVGEMLDPIGAHMSNGKQDVKPSEEKKPDEQAVGVDVSEPSPVAPERGTGMDSQAASIASQLSAFGPVEGQRKGRGRQKQAK